MLTRFTARASVCAFRNEALDESPETDIGAFSSEVQK